tara:strand:- start:1 stop:453 length:453 start_codon:yes stop_codon:yes gene_type:complete
MNYYFTGILIILFLLLVIFVKPGHARNEYLNNGSYECRYGDVDLSISKREREQDYHTYNSNDYDDDSHELRLSFRKYLGISKKHCDEQNRIRTQNETLKQQIELYKVCKGIRTSDPLPQFAELIAYCNGTKPFETRDRVNPYKEMIESIK